VLAHAQLGDVDDDLLGDVGGQADHFDGLAVDFELAAHGDALGLARYLHEHVDVDGLLGIDAIEVHVVHLILPGVVLHHPDEARVGLGLAAIVDDQIEHAGGAHLLERLAEGQVFHHHGDVQALVVVVDAGDQLFGAHAAVGALALGVAGPHGEAHLFLHGISPCSAWRRASLSC